MNRQSFVSAIEIYRNRVQEEYELGNIESSYNDSILNLFRCFGCGAIDLSGGRKGKSGENIDIQLWHNEDEITKIEPFAGIEVKKVGGIDARARKQIKVEANTYGSVILTDNCEWLFWHSNESRPYASIHLMELKNGQFLLLNDEVDLFISLVEEFLTNEPKTIKSSQKLAQYMALYARSIRDLVVTVLKQDTDGNPDVNTLQSSTPMFRELYPLYLKLKNELNPNLDTFKFADLYAQTIVYALFIARYNDRTKETFDRFEAIGNVQNESELLKQFFMHITTSSPKPALDTLIDRLCNLYRICNVEELMDRNGRDDAVVNFYEEFLSYYDPDLRKRLGVYYTPVQIVRYLVREVDRILKDDFNIPAGLSDNELISTKVQSERYQVNSKKWNDKRTIEVPRVAILDPACGTGSFLAETIKFIKEEYFADGNSSFYDQYIQNDSGLLSRLVGFEIMMTSYVIAHLKLRQSVTETLGHLPDRRLPSEIYLTDTLAAPHSDIERIDQLTLWDFSVAITDEAYHADTWKTRRPIKVIIGNPPYNSASKNKYDTSAYKTETDGVTDFGEKKHWLNDDYVQFFKFSEDIINRYGEGILAFVSNNGYLDNPTFRGMRASLLRTFDKIYIVNLHGSSNKGDRSPDGSVDENVFDIKVGIALFIGVKTSKSRKWAKLYYADVWGSRERKFQVLDNGSLTFDELRIDKDMAYFIPFDTSHMKNYENGVSIGDLFSKKVSGVTSGKDSVALASNRDTLIKRIDTVKYSLNDDVISNLWGKFNRGQTPTTIRNDLLNNDGCITRIAYKPFITLWTYYSGRSRGWLLWPREKTIMGQMLQPPTTPIGANIGLVFCKTSRDFFKPFVTNNIIAHRFFSARCEITYVAPLYMKCEGLENNDKWISNLDVDAFKRLTQYLEDKPSPVDVFDYVYGILHDPIYCEQYKEYLTRGFPRVPVINVPKRYRKEGDFFVNKD